QLPGAVAEEIARIAPELAVGVEIGGRDGIDLKRHDARRERAVRRPSPDGAGHDNGFGLHQRQAWTHAPVRLLLREGAGYGGNGDGGYRQVGYAHWDLLFPWLQCECSRRRALPQWRAVKSRKGCSRSRAGSSPPRNSAPRPAPRDGRTC